MENSSFRRSNFRGAGQLDFVSDSLTDGRRFRILAIVDDFTRESLALIPDIPRSPTRHRRSSEPTTLPLRPTPPTVKTSTQDSPHNWKEVGSQVTLLIVSISLSASFSSVFSWRPIFNLYGSPFARLFRSSRLGPRS